MLLFIPYLVASFYLLRIHNSYMNWRASSPVDRPDGRPSDFYIPTLVGWVTLPQFPVELPSPSGLSDERPEMILSSLTSIGFLAIGASC